MVLLYERGLQAVNEKNDIDITPARYMKENSFANIAQMEIFRHYIMEMIGEWEWNTLVERISSTT